MGLQVIDAGNGLFQAVGLQTGVKFGLSGGFKTARVIEADEPIDERLLRRQVTSGDTCVCTLLSGTLDKAIQNFRTIGAVPAATGATTFRTTILSRLTHADLIPRCIATKGV